MKNTLPSFVTLSLLSSLTLATAVQAQSTREADRLQRRIKSIESPDATQPVETTEPAAPAETAGTESVPQGEAESPVAPEPVVLEVPEPVVAVEPVPVVDIAQLEAEVARDPASYQNENYSFQLTDKGFLRRLTVSGGSVLIDSAGAVNLQGSYVTPEGRRVWFYAGGVGNSTYTSTRSKTVRDGAVVFDVSVNHPRFSMVSTMTCREKSIDVTVRLTPIRLDDERGEINAIYAVQLWPSVLTEEKAVTSPDRVLYTTKAGALEVGYGGGWQPGEGTGAREIRVGDTGLAFYFDGRSDPEKDELRYTITLP